MRGLPDRVPFATRAIRATYPALNWLRSRPAYYRRAAPYLAQMTFDDVRFSNRGNEPEAHLRRTRRFVDLRGADVLVLGVGSGDELGLWSRQRPRSLVATDFFAQQGQWASPGDTSFAAMDVRSLAFADDTFDLVASTALLEHVDDVDACAREMARVTRPGGVVFANFGPLWHCYGGAHYLGAYEHLAMGDAAFEAWLVARDIAYEREEALHWLRNGMFSRKTYDEYLAILSRHFDMEHVTLAVSPAALRYKRRNPAAWRELTKRYDEKDLLTYAMTAWMRPKARVIEHRAAPAPELLEVAW